LRDDVAWLAGALLAVDFWQNYRLVVNPLGSIWSVAVSGSPASGHCTERYRKFCLKPVIAQ
jgi:hypothetical protein